MIYFDNAATSKPDEECLKRAEKYLYNHYYNPSALYAEGYSIQLELREARKNILSLVSASGNFDLIFTSCGTEADNQAIFGGGKRGNVVTTLGEHSAVYSAVGELKQRGIDVRFAKLNSDGSVNTHDLLNLIDEKTSLVSVIHVSNETGAVNDISAISAKVKAKNVHTLFHSDGVQAFGKIDFKLTNNIDLYSISAHKIGGLKGCGALIKRKNLVIKPYIFGGGQEQGLRSGTENVFGIKNFEFAAVKRYSQISQNYYHVRKLNDLLWEKLDKTLFTRISPENNSPYILTVGVEELRGETILHEVNDKGLIIGTGSACASNEKKRYSRVILACGISESLADGILRFSFSPENTVEEIKKAAEILNGTVKNRKQIMS
ncbi:MAG: cysteine desulfurase [Clostridiales bacterium]|nr:cysteine desulfurase [Clostridiales bacterium]